MRSRIEAISSTRPVWGHHLSLGAGLVADAGIWEPVNAQVRDTLRLPVAGQIVEDLRNAHL